MQSILYYLIIDNLSICVYRLMTFITLNKFWTFDCMNFFIFYLFIDVTIFHVFLSYLNLSYYILYYYILSYLILLCLILSYFISQNLIVWSFLILCDMFTLFSGPVLVYLGGYEAPPKFTVYGGICLIFALALNRWENLIEKYHDWNIYY